MSGKKNEVVSSNITPLHKGGEEVHQPINMDGPEQSAAYEVLAGLLGQTHLDELAQNLVSTGHRYNTKITLTIPLKNPFDDEDIGDAIFGLSRIFGPLRRALGKRALFEGNPYVFDKQTSQVVSTVECVFGGYRLFEPEHSFALRGLGSQVVVEPLDVHDGKLTRQESGEQLASLMVRRLLNSQTLPERFGRCSVEEVIEKDFRPETERTLDFKMSVGITSRRLRTERYSKLHADGLSKVLDLFTALGLTHQHDLGSEASHKEHPDYDMVERTMSANIRAFFSGGQVYLVIYSSEGYHPLYLPSK